MRGILNIGANKDEYELQRHYPLSYGKNGLPFIYPYYSLPDKWYLVDLYGEKHEISTNLLTYDPNKSAFYYSAATDLVEYLAALGVAICTGLYFFEFILAGSYKYSQIFKLEADKDLPPVGRAFSSGFSGGFS